MDGRYTFDFEAMEQSITSIRVTATVIRTTRWAASLRGELLKLADFCVKHDLWLVSDEIHCDLILDEGLKHVAAEP